MARPAASGGVKASCRHSAIPAGGVIKGGGQLVPLVQHLGQAHMRHAQMGRLAADLTGDLQRLPVGRERRIQVALGALYLAQVVADPGGEVALASRPPLGEGLGQAAFSLPGLAT